MSAKVCTFRHYPLVIRITVKLALSAIWISSPAQAAQLSTTTSLTLSAPSIASGQPVTLTAAVLAGTTPVTIGRVIFCDATAIYCENAALLGIAQLTSAGTATLKFIPGIGSHTYFSGFLSTSAAAASTSSQEALSVTGTHPTTAAISSSGSAGSYTLTGTVVGPSSPNVSLTASVSFLDITNSNYMVGSATLGPATLAQTFATQVAYATGSGPDAVAVGDFNGDGNLDLAVANYNSNNVSILLGNGDGTFQTQVIYAAGSGAESLGVGDFNGDGNPDLVVANNGGATVGVLLNLLTQTATAAISGIAIPGSGTHLIDGSYPGDTNFSSSASSTVSLTATPITTTLVLTATE